MLGVYPVHYVGLQECLSTREGLEPSFLSYLTFSNPDNITRRWRGWDARLDLLNMELAFVIL